MTERRDAKTIPSLEDLQGVSEHHKKIKDAPRPGGRPTKYRVAFCEALPGMFAKGESVAEVCVGLGIGRTAFHDWVNRYPKFKRAYEQGQFLSEAWWMAFGRAATVGLIDANVTAWIFNMKNRFKWRDKPDPEIVGDDEMTPEEFARRAHDALIEMEEADHGGNSAGNFADVEMDTPSTTH